MCIRYMFKQISMFLEVSMSFANVTLQSEIKNLCKQIISLRQKTH